MVSEEILGYVRFKDTGKIVPYVDVDENGFRIMYDNGSMQWLGRPYFEQVDGPVVKGVGKDAPTVTNEHGGKQSKVLYRFDLLDPKAMFEMTKVLSEGAEKYGADNWRLISVKEHLNHLIIHAYAYLAGDNSDDHLSHILCRAMFAQGVEIQEG